MKFGKQQAWNGLLTILAPVDSEIHIESNSLVKFSKDSLSKIRKNKSMR